MTDAAGLEKFRAYLTLLARVRIDPRLQGKLDLSGIVQQTFRQTWAASRAA